MRCEIAFAQSAGRRRATVSRRAGAANDLAHHHGRISKWFPGAMWRARIGSNAALLRLQALDNYPASCVGRLPTLSGSDNDEASEYPSWVNPALHSVPPC